MGSAFASIPSPLTEWDRAALRSIQPLPLTDAERRVIEAGKDDHFYGGWSGGSRTAGGFPKNEDSDTRHRSANGEYDPERVSGVHEPYYAATLKGVPTSASPTVYMTGGGPASGKTTGLLNNPQAGIPGTAKAAHINADDAKEYIPEYRAGVKAGNKAAASYAHEESSYMSKVGMARALGSGHDVVYDSVADSGIAKLSSKVQQMREQGAKRVEASYATLDVKEAIRRSDVRAMATGRFVPHAFIEAAHADVARTTLAAVNTGVFDSLKVFDTGGPLGKPPRLIATYDKAGKGLTVTNSKLWAAFLARAGDTT